MIETTGETFRKEYVGNGVKRCTIYRKQAANFRASYPAWHNDLACFVLANADIKKAVNKKGQCFTSDVNSMMQFKSYATAAEFKHHVIEAWLQEPIEQHTMSTRQRIAITLNRAKFTAKAADAMMAQTKMALSEVVKLVPKGDVNELYNYHANMSYMFTQHENVSKELEAAMADWDNLVQAVMSAPTLPPPVDKDAKRRAKAASKKANRHA